jgi:hypothetical protein
MLRQDRDFSTIDAGKRQFEERWRWESSVIYMGLISGPNKADDTCGKTTGTMFHYINADGSDNYHHL